MENRGEKKKKSEIVHHWAEGSHFDPPRPLAHTARPLPPHAHWVAGPLPASYMSVHRVRANGPHRVREENRKMPEAQTLPIGVLSKTGPESWSTMPPGTV
jgi:hypothetical protein